MTTPRHISAIAKKGYAFTIRTGKNMINQNRTLGTYHVLMGSDVMIVFYVPFGTDSAERFIMPIRKTWI